MSNDNQADIKFDQASPSQPSRHKVWPSKPKSTKKTRKQRLNAANVTNNKVAYYNNELTDKWLYLSLNN